MSAGRYAPGPPANEGPAHGALALGMMVAAALAPLFAIAGAYT